jgi:hypothetical protein
MSVKTCLLAGSVMAALTGCITSSRAYLPDGTEGWSVSCPSLRSYDSCLSEAERVCSGHYEIVDVADDPSAGITAGAARNDASMTVDTTDQTLMVSCQ